MKIYMIPLLVFVGVLFCAFDQRNTINDHEYVDLGLSVMWATCNIGADNPEEYGNYFAWGETEPKEEYTRENCKTGWKEIGNVKGTSRDVAHVKWGSPWRMPTLEEFQELIDNCDWEWVMPKGKITGYRVTSKKNGNSIFLPAAGWRYGVLLYNAGEGSFYWSSTPYESGTQNAYGLYFSNDYYDWDWSDRSDGHSVRAVFEF